MISKLYTIISNKLWDLSLYFGDRYNRWVLASQQKALGPCKCARFRAKQTYRNYSFAICWRLSAFESPSHEKMPATADFRLRPHRAWHYNHVTFTPIAKNFMLYCRLIYMLSILCVRLTIKVKVGIPESFKVGWCPPKKLGRVTLIGQF